MGLVFTFTFLPVLCATEYTELGIYSCNIAVGADMQQYDIISVVPFAIIGLQRPMAVNR